MPSNCTIKTYYACKHNNNFGDMLTPFILSRLGYTHKHTQKGKHVILAGSILQETNDDSIVMGAGFGAKTQTIGGNPEIHIVRGPLSAEMLGGKYLYGDPGVVLPLVYKPKPVESVKSLLLPHYVDFPKIGGFDICSPVTDVIDAICSSKEVVTSSLHGWIVAEAYGIPVHFKKFGNKIAGDGMKYKDYRESKKFLQPTKILTTIRKVLYGYCNSS